MNSLLLLLVLGGPVNPDGGIPLWAPRLKPVDSVEGSYALHKWGEGYFYEDARFEARVAPDGTVGFKDKRGSATFIPLSWAVKGTDKRPAPLPERSAKDPAAGRRAPWLPPPEQTRTPSRMPPKEELCPPGSRCWFPPSATVIGVEGTFDLTEELMRTLGKDPHALEKAHFLSATFEFRIQMAIAVRKRQMKQALENFPRYLDELWADTRYSPRERRRILCELWYETDRTPDGARAAQMIDAFVTKHLPCGAADGYTAGELDAFHTSHPERPFKAADRCR
jgi:hypothetical protein